MLLSGLAIWKPVQLAALTALFLVVHVTLVVLVPKTFVAMVPSHESAPAHAGEER